MKIQPEFLSIKTIKQAIPAESNNDITEIDELFTMELKNNDYRIEEKFKYLKVLYAEVLKLDLALSIGSITNTKAAKRLRKGKITRMVNYMITNRIIDRNILKAENVSESEFLSRYYKRLITGNFLQTTIQKHKFIENELNRLADIGEPYHTKNERLIADKQDEIYRLESPFYKPNLFGEFVKPRQIETLKHDIKILHFEDEEGGKYFPIENLCCVIKYQSRNNMKIHPNKTNSFAGYDYFYLSPSSQDNLIALIVKLYKAEYSKEIAEHRKQKKKVKRKNKNLKRLSVNDKLNIVQKLKNQGLTYTEARKKLDFSESTFLRYWNKTG